jgi:hypothetical protein
LRCRNLNCRNLALPKIRNQTLFGQKSDIYANFLKKSDV